MPCSLITLAARILSKPPEIKVIAFMDFINLLTDEELLR